MASNQDPRSPLEILPIEVWEKIFTNLNSRDLISCYRTAESWRKELEKRRTEFLMTEVFALICNSLGRNDVASSRLVCRAWKESAEESLQNHASLFAVIPSYHLVKEAVNPQLLRCRNDVIPKSLNFNFDFMLWRDEHFLTRVPESCINPFLNRSVNYLDSRATPEERGFMLGILERFGREVWHFRLSMRIAEEGSSSNASTIYQLTRSFLMLMPNLKTLDLSFCVSPRFEIDEEEYLLTPEKEELIRSQPLPPLNNLVALQHYGLINPLEAAVWQQYGAVVKLALRNDHLIRSPLFKDVRPNARLDRVEELYISPGTLEDFWRLRNMSLNSPWPLRIFSVDFLIRDESSLEIIFRTISHFGATLQHLGMHLRTSQDSTTPLSELFHGRRLDLPQLETLKVTKPSWRSNNFIRSLGFLQPCTSLKVLELSCIGDYNLESLAPILSCPLRTLKIKVMENENLWMVLDTLSRLGATLRHLELNLNGLYFSDLSANNLSSIQLTTRPLNLPRLETLVIRAEGLVVDTLDFIGGCVSLKKLAVIAQHTDPIRLSDFPQDIQYRGYFASMNESNLWRVFPNLEVLELDTCPNPYPDTNIVFVPVGFCKEGRVDRIYTRKGYSEIVHRNL